MLATCSTRFGEQFPCQNIFASKNSVCNMHNLKKWCNPLPIDLAEYVLNKCITQDEPVQQIKRQISSDGEVSEGNSTVTTDQPVHYNFEYLEDMDKDRGNHILDCMVSLHLLTLRRSCIRNILLFIFGD